MSHDDPREQIDGFLFAKLLAIGTRSERIRYSLQRWDYTELPLFRDESERAPDPTLQELLGRKVRVLGVRSPRGLVYDEVTSLMVGDGDVHPEASGLELALRTEEAVLRVDRGIPRPAGCRIHQYMDLTLEVSWKGKGAWCGRCPTTQVYDFSIWRGERELWRWSVRRLFADVPSTVVIPSGPPTELSVTWHFDPRELEEPGTYIARATFIASAESVERAFEVQLIG